MNEQIKIDFNEEKVNMLDFDTNGLFTFTGNPIVDNGMAVLANIAGKENYGEITPDDIKKNIDSFFKIIKYQYNDEQASEKEQKSSKKKMKQHLTSLYTTNHYLHGINNTSNFLINVKLISNDNEKFYNELSKKEIPYKIRKVKISKKEIKFQIFNEDKHIMEREVFENSLSDLSDYDFKIRSYKKASVEFNNEYFQSFKQEVINTLQNTSKTLTDKRRIQKSKICNFCGKNSDITLSKDIFPLTSALGDFNLGVIYICRYCYLASFFSFFNYINFKKEAKKSGMYFFYHFSNPEVMIEYSKIQIKHLQNEKMASLQTIVGGKYSSVFNDLFEKIKNIKSIKKYKPSVTVYFLLNDNRGAIYETLSLPNGLLNFWLFLHSNNYQGEWKIIHSKLSRKEDYDDFISGNLKIRRYYDELKQPILKIQTIKNYLKEVAQMKEELIEICEDLSNSLVKYFKELHKRKPKRENWTEDFYDFFKLKKSYELFNNLFSFNNEYFKWTEGENLISVSSAKQLLEEFKLYNLFYGLIEYFILNSFNNEEKEQYFNYANKKKNIKED